MYIDQMLAHQIEMGLAHHEAASVEILRNRFSLPTASVLSFGGGYAIRSGNGYPINRGMGIGFHQGITSSDLDHFEAFYQDGGLLAEIELSPFVDESFIKVVAQRGYTLYRFYNVYTLRIPSDLLSLSNSSSIHIRQIHEEENVLWAQTVAGKLQAKDPIVMLGQATFYQPEVICFLATIQGEIAGGAALSIHNDMGILSFMRTIPSFRQRGVQNALIRERIAVATAQGCTLIVCSTNPGNQSQRNVERAGFSLAYTKVFLRKQA
jgi:ribosomal protein S18 acetylase RimI-like enzyme